MFSLISDLDFCNRSDGASLFTLFQIKADWCFIE